MYIIVLKQKSLFCQGITYRKYSKDFDIADRQFSASSMQVKVGQEPLTKMNSETKCTLVLKRLFTPIEAATSLGIGGNLLRWTENFLAERAIVVRLGSELSD